MKKDSVFLYIGAFCMIMLFIVITFGSYMYVFFYQTIYSDFKEQNILYLDEICTQHEEGIQVIKDVMTQLSLSGGDVEFKLKDYPAKNFSLKERLKQYTTVSQFFDRVFFFYHGDQYVYGSTTSMQIDRFLDKGMALTDQKPEQLKEIMYQEEGGIIVLPEQKVKGYLVERTGKVIDQGVVFFVPMEPAKKSTGVFLVGKNYYDTLFGNVEKSFRQSGIYCGGKLISSRGSSEQYFNLEDFFCGKPEGQKKIKTCDGKYLVSWKTGKSGMVYWTAQSMSVFNNKILNRQWGILVVLAICVIPTFFLVTVLSGKLSQKVKNINLLLGASEDYNLGCMENGIRTLIEKTDESREERILLRKTQFISNFVRGQFKCPEKIFQAAEEAEFNWDRRYFVIAIMGDRENGNDTDVAEMMLKAIERRPGVDGYGISLTGNNQSIYAIVGDTIQELNAVLEEIFITGKNHLEQFVMACSDIHNNFMNASDAYLEADSAYGMRLITDNGSILWFKSVHLEEFQVFPSDVYLQRLRQAIRNMDKEQAEMVIVDICSHLKATGKSLLAFRMFCNDVIGMLVAESQNEQSDFTGIYNVFALSQCLTIQDFQNILLDACNSLIDAAISFYPEGKKKKETDIAALAAEYMKAHYCESDLNMSLLADQLGISNVTLAIKFKNEMEISPSDYLAILRMEAAKRMLRETDMAVKDIRAAVGYEDDRVFQRRFKKYTGKTPRQYREEND